ncbi:MAG: hypothetical protein SFV55_01810 [Haliscomenobacter sp.]|uniref:hypothetical protein n=1 Tax=Haliscomenobacter sp. TaxID=2717303 RepID=UPI0029BF1BC7|nr:hypothetical protein [Haliscomenobacter sp.]MDX2067126.1 hypothetical protein [Haliscomenobacter sp.]
MNLRTAHTFHIPVMGLSYTIDSPIKVARFGISSVVSIMEDHLIEIIREHYCQTTNRHYEPITQKDPDYRAKRITAYLNLMNAIVGEQMQKMRADAFVEGSEIVQYFEMLPEGSPLKKSYQDMVTCPDEQERLALQNHLRTQLVAGSILVNIMTKVDGDKWDKQGDIIPNGSDAVTALRGYINSNLDHSAIVFSAGMNPRLYTYLEQVDAFDPDENLQFRKKIVIKVSDYRSALIQGKFLAKKGIWVSEFRIESGLNCGGHAFASDGFLLGPILEEFKSKRQELTEGIFELYKTAIHQKLGRELTQSPAVDITVQGGIGTFEEDVFLHAHYGVASTGWGTPFLLVPEATTVDEHTLNLLCQAKEQDLVLSNSSPLGVRFHYLRGTTADVEKQTRIVKGKPGSPCPEKLLSFNTEFTKEPICTASSKYQKLKLKQLKTMDLTEAEFEKQQTVVLEKECLCIGLSNSAALAHGVTFLEKYQAVNICPGPNIVNFSKIVSLKTMIDHIYGRTNLVNNPSRPHMFMAEMKLYLNYLKEQLISKFAELEDRKTKNYFRSFIGNLADAIVYYQNLPEGAVVNRPCFDAELAKAEVALAGIKETYSFE